MNIYKQLLFFVCVILLSAYIWAGCKSKADNKQASTPLLEFVLTNESEVDRLDEIVSISIDELQHQFNSPSWDNICFVSGDTIAHQLLDYDGDNTPEEILLLVDLSAGEKKKVSISFLDQPLSFSKRTQAELSFKEGGMWKAQKYVGGTFKNTNELRVPDEHTDHSEFIRYEGPGWESDKVGYRFYLDWRNAVDIFGKKTSDMVLQRVGLDGFDSYHEPSNWGMDILKVGKSLGLGSVGYWKDDHAIRIEKTDSLHCTISENGPIMSKIQTQYFGWQVNNKKTTLTSRLSINAGSRLTRHDISMTNPLDNLCTGIVKHEDGKLIQQIPNDESQWGYLATYGKQSLNDDNLGMAVFFNKNNYQQITSDEHSHIVVLSPDSNALTYYFAAAWEQEQEGIKNEDDFKLFLSNEILKLNNMIVFDH